MLKKYLLLTVLLLASLDLFAQTTIVLNPDKDNSLYNNVVTVNDPPLSNGLGIGIFAGRTNRIPLLRRALMHFDIAGNIPAGATIKSAELSLQVTKVPDPPPTVSMGIFSMTADWGEGASIDFGPGGQGVPAQPGDATWGSPFNDASSWTSPGGDFSLVASATQMVGPLGSYSWGTNAAMVADVQSWLDSPSANFGWILIGDESVNLTAKRFGSREQPDPNLRPRLTIVYNSLPVELTEFTVIGASGNLELNWTTASEENNSGFEIEVSAVKSRAGEDLESPWTNLGFVAGRGTTTQEENYTFTLHLDDPGTYRFRLRQIDYDGGFQFSPVIETTVEVFGTHKLSNAYPNPFSSQSTFDLSLASAQDVKLGIYNTLGQKVLDLFDGQLEAESRYQFDIQGNGLPTGLYFIRVDAESFSDSKRIVLLR